MTAATAGALLGALWFVPSANATAEDDRAVDRTAAQTAAQPERPVRPAAAEQSGARTASLAATGSVDTTPYLVGGSTFLGFGVIMLAHSARRSRRAYARPS